MSDVERIAQIQAAQARPFGRDGAAIEADIDFLLAALARRDAAIQAVRNMLTDLVADKRSLWVSSDSIRSVIEYTAIATEGSEQLRTRLDKWA